MNITVSTNELYVKGGKSGVEIVTFTSTEPIQVTYEQITNGLNGYTRVSIVDNFTTNVTWKIEYSGLNVHNEIYKGEIHARLTGSDEDLVVPVTIDCSVPSTNRIETTCKTLYVKGEKNGTETVVFTCAEPIEVTYEQFTNNLNGNVRVWIENNFTNEVTWNVEYSDLYLCGETYSGLIHARLSGDVDSLDVPVVINCSDTLIYVDINKGEESIEFSFSSLPEINSLCLIGDNILDIYSHSDKYNIENERLGNYKYLTAANGLSQISIDLDDYKPQELPPAPLPPLEGFSNEIYRYKNSGDGNIRLALKHAKVIETSSGVFVRRSYDVVKLRAIDAYTNKEYNLFETYGENDQANGHTTDYTFWTLSTNKDYVDVRLKIEPIYWYDGEGENNDFPAPYSMLFNRCNIYDIIGGDLILPKVSDDWKGWSSIWSSSLIYPEDTKEYWFYSIFKYSDLRRAIIPKVNDDRTVSFDDRINMFNGCKYLTDLSNVTNINVGPFIGCVSLEDISVVSTWDIPNHTSLWAYFSDCAKLSNISPLKNWDASKIVSLYYFLQGTNVSDLSPLKDWNVSNVVSLDSFLQGTKVTDLSPLKDWNVSNVDSLSHFLQGTKVTDLSPLKDWNVSNVTNLRGCFVDCDLLKDASVLSSWNTSSVTTMYVLFYGCDLLETVPELDATSVTNIGMVFYGCPKLKNLGGFKNLKVNLDLSGSPLLTHDSLMNVINNLAVVTNRTLSLGGANWNKLTFDEKKIAVDKGWTVS